MTRFRSRPPAEYLMLIVVPEPGFQPTNWQQTPRQYRVVRCAGAALLRGQADAWKFLFNQRQLRNGNPQSWALVVPLEDAGRISRQGTHPEPGVAHSKPQRPNGSSAASPQPARRTDRPEVVATA